MAEHGMIANTEGFVSEHPYATVGIVGGTILLIWWLSSGNSQQPTSNNSADVAAIQGAAAIQAAQISAQNQTALAQTAAAASTSQATIAANQAIQTAQISADQATTAASLQAQAQAAAADAATQQVALTTQAGVQQATLAAAVQNEQVQAGLSAAQSANYAQEFGNLANVLGAFGTTMNQQTNLYNNTVNPTQGADIAKYLNWENQMGTQQQGQLLNSIGNVINANAGVENNYLDQYFNSLAATGNAPASGGVIELLNGGQLTFGNPGSTTTTTNTTTTNPAPAPAANPLGISMTANGIGFGGGWGGPNPALNIFGVGLGPQFNPGGVPMGLAPLYGPGLPASAPTAPASGGGSTTTTTTTTVPGNIPGVGSLGSVWDVIAGNGNNPNYYLPAQFGPSDLTSLFSGGSSTATNVSSNETALTGSQFSNLFQNMLTALNPASAASFHAG